MSRRLAHRAFLLAFGPVQRRDHRQVRFAIPRPPCALTAALTLLRLPSSPGLPVSPPAPSPDFRRPCYACYRQLPQLVPHRSQARHQARAGCPSRLRVRRGEEGARDCRPQGRHLDQERHREHFQGVRVQGRHLGRDPRRGAQGRRRVWRDPDQVLREQHHRDHQPSRRA